MDRNLFREFGRLKVNWENANVAVMVCSLIPPKKVKNNSRQANSEVCAVVCGDTKQNEKKTSSLAMAVDLFVTL